MAVTFESYERRIEQIKPVMEKYGIKAASGRLPEI